jgi:hypothetical protein
MSKAPKSTKPTVSLAEMSTWQSGLTQMAVHRVIRRYCDDFLQQYNLSTMQWLVIGAIYESGDKGTRVTDLAEKAGTTLSYMTTTLNKLQDMRIICRIDLPGDNRSRAMIVCEHFRPNLYRNRGRHSRCLAPAYL